MTTPDLEKGLGGPSPSPSPSPSQQKERHEKQQHHHHHHHHNNNNNDTKTASASDAHEDTLSPGAADTIWGIRRRMFWVILAIGTLVVVCAVGVGVGAGIAFNHAAGSEE
jgi:hypothetical protein